MPEIVKPHLIQTGRSARGLEVAAQNRVSQAKRQHQLWHVWRQRNKARSARLRRLRVNHNAAIKYRVRRQYLVQA